MSDFDQLCDACWEPVHRYLHAKLRDDEAASEGLQEVFLRVLRLPDHLRVERKPRDEWLPYLIVVARNYVSEVRRGKRPKEVPFPLGRAVSGEGGMDERMADSESLRQVFLSRSDRDREVLTLAYGFGLSLSQIAEILGITIVAARERRRMARHRLSEALKELGEILPDPKDWPQDRGPIPTEMKS